MFSKAKSSFNRISCRKNLPSQKKPKREMTHIPVKVSLPRCLSEILFRTGNRTGGRTKQQQQNPKNPSSSNCSQKQARSSKPTSAALVPSALTGIWTTLRCHRRRLCPASTAQQRGMSPPYRASGTPVVAPRSVL